jgi:hypothetical protein
MALGKSLTGFARLHNRPRHAKFESDAEQAGAKTG